MLDEESPESDVEYGKCRSSADAAPVSVNHEDCCSRIATSRNTKLLLTAAACIAAIVAAVYLGGGDDAQSRYSVPSFTDATGHNSEVAGRRLWGKKKPKPKPTEEKKSAGKSSVEGKAPEAQSHSSGSTTKGPPPTEIKKAEPPATTATKKATEASQEKSAFVANPWHEDLPEVHDPCRDDPAFHHGINGKACRDWVERVGRQMLHQARCAQGVGILNSAGEEFKVKDYCKESCGVCGWGPWAENNEYTKELKVLEAEGVNTRVTTNHPTPKPSNPPSKEPTSQPSKEPTSHPTSTTPVKAAKPKATANDEATAETSLGGEPLASKVHASSEESAGSRTAGSGTQSHDGSSSSGEIEGSTTAGSVMKSHGAPQETVGDETPPSMTEHSSESQSHTDHADHTSTSTITSSEHTGAAKSGTSGSSSMISAEAEPTSVHSDESPATLLSSTRPLSEESKAPEPSSTSLNEHASKTSKTGGHVRS